MENRNTEDVIEIDLQEIFMILLHWLWLILLCGFAVGAVCFSVNKFMVTPMYKSTTKVYILNKNDGGDLTYSDVQLGTQLTKDYTELIKGRDVLEPVLATCGLNESYGSFSQRVSVQNVSDTRIIAITVEDADPLMAQFIANEICVVAAEHIKSVMDIQAVNVAEQANLPTAPSSPNVMKNTMLGFLLGACVCAGVLIVRHLMDDTIKTSEDVEKYLGLSTLAMIPIIEEEDKSKSKRKRSGRQSSSATGGTN